MLQFNMLLIKSTEKSIDLPVGDYRLGRCLPCELILEQETVSAQHCRIWLRGDRWFIMDLDSTNGTLLNGFSLIPKKEYALPIKAHVKMGQVMMEIMQNPANNGIPPLSRPLIILHRHENTSAINRTTFPTLNRALPNKKENLCPDSSSSIMQNIYREAAELAASNLPIAIEGETGTGKELLARFIHKQSGRSGKLVTILPMTSETLQESEFFGYKKGAFTGADRDYPGKIKLAANGTLFLDELSHIPDSLQIKLLRFLENGEIFPLGAQQVETIDARLLVASNLPFKNLLEQGQMRKDVFYRLCSIVFTLPPLRERPEDILLLFTTFFNEASPRGQVIADSNDLPEEMRSRLKQYSWPGNIRELKNEARRISHMAASSGSFSEKMLSPGLLEEAKLSPAWPAQTRMIIPGKGEAETLINVLRKCLGNKSLAAKQLGISRRGLYKKLDRLGIDLKTGRL